MPGRLRSMVGQTGMVALSLFLLLSVCLRAEDTVTLFTAPSVSSPASLRLDHPVHFQGKLGEEPVEMSLQPKPDEQDSVKGTYRQAAAHTEPVLLAGEYTGSQLVMEESVNGRDVSGEWYGEIHGDTYTGTWSTLDDKIKKPFSLRLDRNTSP